MTRDLVYLLGVGSRVPGALYSEIALVGASSQSISLYRCAGDSVYSVVQCSIVHWVDTGFSNWVESFPDIAVYISQNVSR